jgi:outer membrane protein OmpA-like peptidoglycan-associated protein
MIRFWTVPLLASIWLASTVTGGAQTVDNGTEVRVNPMAGSGSVLLYPGGEYMRVVPHLLQPGQRGGPIHLHMPVKHVVRAKPAAPADAFAQAPQPPKPEPKPERKPSPAPRMASAAPAKPAPGYDFGSMPSGAANLFHYTTPPASAPAQAPAPKPRTQIAKAEPAPAETPVPGLTKQSMILFAHDAADPAEAALGNLKLLAVQLNVSMVGPGSRVQIQAYGGAKGDKGSDARRLSLKRALAIRQILIDDGVPSERIDVRAMGGVDDSGPTDRVDVYVKA